MSPTNKVPEHLLNSGIDAMSPDTLAEEAEGARNKPKEPVSATAPPPARSPQTPAPPRKNLPALVAGGLLLVLLGGYVGAQMAHRGDNPTIATVNGVGIDQKQYVHRCESLVATGSLLNNTAIGPQVLRQMVLEELALQYAGSQKVMPTDSDVEKRFDKTSKVKDFDENLHKALQTPEDVKHNIKVALARANVITKGVSVSDQEVEAFYKAYSDPRNPKALYSRPDAVQIAAIISNNEADIRNALHDLASGASFADVAKRYSKDKSMANGGLLPPIQHGMLNSKQFPGVENRLFDLKPGQQIDDMKVGSNYWLVRCVGRSQETRIPFDQVRDECRDNALLVKASKANGKAVEENYKEFVKDAHIEALLPQYRDAVNINAK
jgi:parvulin-like peptidyl-prolyl isomerase